MSHRPRRVAELMKHELADLLAKDFEFGSVLVTIHDIELTPDLKHAEAFVGMIGPEAQQREVMKKLRRAAPGLSSKLSRRVILRHTPTLSFKHDTSVERGVRILSIIEEIDQQTPPEEPPYPKASVPTLPKEGEDKSDSEHAE